MRGITILARYAVVQLRKLTILYPGVLAMIALLPISVLSVSSATEHAGSIAKATPYLGLNGVDGWMMN